MDEISYITSDQLKATLAIAGTQGDADVTAAISAASRAINGICQRNFGPGGAGEIRYYNPDRRRALEIDDLYSLESLATDDNGDGTFVSTWTEGTDFDLEPLNASNDGWPWTSIRVRRNGNYTFIPWYTRSARVTGTFGWPAVPDDVVTATTLLASRIYMISRNAPLDVIPGGDQGMIRLGRSIPNVMMLLSRYQRHKISVS